MAMNEAQLAALLGRLGGNSVKAPKLESTDPAAFRAWKTNFNIAMEMIPDGDVYWNVAQRKRLAKSSLSGAAAVALHDVDIRAGDNEYTLARLLAAYEARIIPPAASVAAEAAFDAAQQNLGETVIQYHTRLRELFKRSVAADVDAETSRPLIKRFIGGLYEKEVRIYARNDNPATYTAALTTAQRCEAALLQEATDQKDSKRIASLLGQLSLEDTTIAGIDENGAVNAMPDDARRCYFCGKSGHLKRDCSLWNKAVDQLRNGSSGGRGRGTFRGRGRAGQRGRGNQNNTRGRGGSQYSHYRQQQQLHAIQPHEQLDMSQSNEEPWSGYEEEVQWAEN